MENQIRPPLPSCHRRKFRRDATAIPAELRTRSITESLTLVFFAFSAALRCYLFSQMQIIAHRGASFDAPENTLPAIRLAWEQGADAVEVDVHLSRDGRVAV